MLDGTTDVLAPFDLATLPSHLDRIATPPASGGEADELDELEARFLRDLQQLARRVMRADAAVCHRFDEHLVCQDVGSPSAETCPSARSDRAQGLAESAARSGRTEIDRSEAVCLVATVSTRTGGGWHVLVTTLDIGRSAIDPFVVAQQLITSAIPLWQARVAEQQLRDQHQKRGWLDAVSESIERSQTFAHVATTVVDSISIQLGAYQVAFCLQRGDNVSRIDVVAVGGNGTAVDDAVWQAAASESLVRNSPTRWPAAAASETVATIAHRHLAHSVSPQHQAISVPLLGETGKPFAVLVALCRDGDQVLHDLHSASDALGSRVTDWRRNHQPLVRRMSGMFSQLLSSRLRSVMLVVAVVGLAALPVPYRVSTTATVVPRTRSFVVAPHAGLLRETNVRIGDVVEKGTPIAELDDRELRLDLAALLAQRDRAAKQRDILRASGQVAEEQLAEYELALVDEQIKLTQYRLNHLAVVSPIDGVVIAGDLEGVSGAPVETGKLLAEIARLDELWIEFDVPEDELAEIDAGRTVRAMFDTVDGRIISTQIESISPSAQTRNGQNVFVARAGVPNPDGLLRPGISGTAKITSHQRPLVAVLLRQVWRRVSRLWI